MKLQPIYVRKDFFRSPPHGGVWIETLCLRVLWAWLGGHPLTGGCGLKHRLPGSLAAKPMSPPHGGVWIETIGRTPLQRRLPVTPSRGGVD